MIVTSTNIIEGREVLRYFDPISETAVIGANALSEIGASFVALLRRSLRDSSVGDPSIVKTKTEVYKSVLESLKQNARSYRADVVISFSVNIDEILSKGAPIV